MDSKNNLQSCNCFATRKAARYITKVYERHLAAVELTSSQFSILVMLSDQPAMNMRSMSATMAMDRTSLVRALQPMQRDGLIVAAPSESDPRQLRYSLSPAGQTRLRQAVPHWRKAQGEFEQYLGRQEATSLRLAALKVGTEG